MNKPQPPCCPHCGSHQLILHQNSRKIFINHGGERIPLLTVNFNLEHAVIEESATTYTCACTWTGGHSDLAQQG